MNDIVCVLRLGFPHSRPSLLRIRRERLSNSGCCDFRVTCGVPSMKRRILLSAVACLATLSYFPCLAQTIGSSPSLVSAHDSKQKQNLDETIPTLHLEFDSGKPVAGIAASPALVMPIECGSDGTAAIQMLEPPDFQHIALYLIGKSGGRKISLADAPGIINPRPMEVYVSNSVLGVLLNAQKKPSDMSAPPAYGVFLAEFRTDGQFKSLADLTPPERFLHFALLPSGDVVLLEDDAPNGVTRLTLRDPDGTFKSQIQVPNELADALSLPNFATSPHTPGSNLPRTDQERLRVSGLLGLARFTPSGEKVLLSIPGHREVIEIGNGGAIRTIKVQCPEGYRLDGLVPTTDRWLVRFKREGLPESGADLSPASKNLVLFEVASSDGSLRRMLDTGTTPSWTACERDGILTIFKTDDKQQLIPLTAELGR